MKFLILLTCMVSSATTCYLGDELCSQLDAYCKKGVSIRKVSANGCSTSGHACDILKKNCNAEDKPSACKMPQSTGANKRCISARKLAALRRAALSKTNELRRKHGVPPATEDKCINGMAQAYAEKLASINQMKHTEHKDRAYLGENLAMGSFRLMTGAYEVQMWYNEIDKPGYNFNMPGYQPKTGHFTQLVWKTSTKVGHGFAASADCSIIYTVANYDKPGNVDGAKNYIENVLRPRY